MKNMNKKLALQFILLIAFNLSLSAISNSVDSADTYEEKLPDNKMELNEIMEDIKRKINELENKTLLYESYEKAVKDFGESVLKFDEQAISKEFSNMEVILRNKPLDKQKQYQEELNFLNILSGFPGRWNFFTKPEYTDISSPAFYDKTNFPLQKTLASPLITQMQKNHYSNINQTFAPIINTIEDLNAIEEVFNSTFKSELQEIKSLLDEEKKRIISARDEIRIKIAALRKQRGLIRSKLEEDTQINFLAIRLGLPLFCGTILLLFLGPSILKLIRKSNSDQPTSSESRSTLLEISTVLLLTMSILILGLAQRLTGEVLGTLIGGISGYVLNRINTQNSQAPSTPANPK
ncbi:hypothetical protein CNR22_17825 [Sphingobacteriaceae bacterium]|nr:hypothetical protein CNR22_17825 [Sphingobacteriaceae bacterium]